MKKHLNQLSRLKESPGRKIKSIIAEDFNTHLQKWVDHPDRKPNRYSIQQQQNTHSSQAQMGHSPE